MVVGITEIAFCCLTGLMLGIYLGSQSAMGTTTSLQFILLCILNTLGFVGAIFAVLRRKWKLALAGTISVILLVVFGGIFTYPSFYSPLSVEIFIVTAVVVIMLFAVPVALIAISKKEFR